VGWALLRWRQKWEIRGVDDWASLPVLILPLFVLSFIANPIVSAVSRHYEHQADQFGLEVTHGLTPDSSQQAARAFQILGEVDLADPDPNRADVFLFYSHPSIADRVRFALDYSPYWDAQLFEWTQDAIDQGFRGQVREEFQILTFVQDGLITGPDGGKFQSAGFAINCPIVQRLD